ncbi:TNF receptor-associated factor 2-like isoform X1 [Ptychodera flava]|uniref:TNF receptor-associated factor 2-like isoform X1 n=1 Tax=Ptychodera flava TaxID=63121 RepID=UPI00396A0C00
MHLQDHHTQCPEIEVECEFCGQKVIRKEIQNHVDISYGNCPRKMKPCQFRVIGCNMMVELENEDMHNTDFIKEHLDLIFQQIAVLLNVRSQVQENAGEIRRPKDDAQKHREVMFNLRIRQSLKHMEDYLREHPRVATSKVSSSSLKDFTTLLEKLTEAKKDLGLKSDKMENKVTTYADIVAVLSQEVEKSSNIIQADIVAILIKEVGKSSDMIQAMVDEGKSFRERLDAAEAKVKAQDRIIKLKGVTLAEQDLRIQSLEMASYDGILTWKITDFGRKDEMPYLANLVAVLAYFFTSRFGYKMCARIYLNGDGMGKGNHVSLFFVVMKGEFDAILKWPFRQKVTFMWIDQNNLEHMIDAFRPDPHSSSFKRPTEDMNIASGCPLFMPLGILESSQHAYVNDDTAFLRVIVDTHDL